MGRSPYEEVDLNSYLIFRVQKRNLEKRTMTNVTFAHGGVAQLGEHLPCKQGVRSSILLISTTVGMRGDGRTTPPERRAFDEGL